MNNFFKNDYVLRNRLSSLEINKVFITFLKKHLNFFYLNFFNKLSVSLFNSRCLVTLRSRGIHRFYKVSRLCIKSLGLKGQLIGLQKGSW